MALRLRRDEHLLKSARTGSATSRIAPSSDRAQPRALDRGEHEGRATSLPMPWYCVYGRWSALSSPGQVFRPRFPMLASTAMPLPLALVTPSPRAPLLGDGLPSARTGLVEAEHERSICQRYSNRIRSYGLCHLRDGAAAEDLVQQVLLAVLQALRAGRVKESTTWTPTFSERAATW
jgi:hypothetical protein